MTFSRYGSYQRKQKNCKQNIPEILANDFFDRGDYSVAPIMTEKHCALFRGSKSIEKNIF